MLRTLCTLLFFSALWVRGVSISCKRETGASVDTWLILKGPRTTSYLYADSTTTLQPSPNDLNSTTTGALAHTVAQVWTADTYVLYNDEPPSTADYNFTYGHTKGALFMDTNGSGVWLQHSIPQYMAGPATSPAYSGLEQNAWEYGQHMYCMTLPADAMDALAYTLQLALPRIYDAHHGAASRGNVSALLHGVYRTAPLCTSTTLKTVGGTEHILFGKSTQWNNEMWDACIAPSLRTSMLVQSWLHGPENGPYCPTTGYSVRDVKELDYGGNASWDAYYDHSKWGVGNGTVCFGDINRVTTQASRGGAAVCVHAAQYTAPLAAAIQDTNTC